METTKMKTRYAELLLFLLSTVFLVSVCGTSCPSTAADSFKFVVRSRRNETRHRIFTVDAARSANPNRNSSSDLDIDVVYNRFLCEGKETIELNSVLAVLELPLNISDDYEWFVGQGYYKLHTVAQPWENARAICVKEGGHLIVINSDAEANVVKKFFTRKPKVIGTTSSAYLFVGIHDYQKEGEYVAVTGEKFSDTGYSRWASSQPDGSTDQNYVVAESDGLLRDISNTEKLGFICELEFYKN